MASALQIREQIAAFLLNEQSLRSLVEWLTRNIWAANSKDTDARQLAGEVELVVAEYSARHIDQRELRKQLYDLLPNVTVGHSAVSNISMTSHTPLIVFAMGSHPRPSVLTA